MTALINRMWPLETALKRHFYLLAAAGLLLGYFSQANWAGQHNESLTWYRILGGVVGTGLLYPCLIMIWCGFWAWLLKRDLEEILNLVTPLAAALPLVFFFPSPVLTRLGVLTASVALTLAASLLAIFLARGMSPAYLICLGIMAAVCVELHDLVMKFYDAVGVERALKWDAQALFRYRVLVHVAAGALESVFQAPAFFMEKLIRTFATFSIFLVSIRAMGLFVRPGVALAAPLVHMVMLPFSYLFLYVTDEMEVLGAWLLLWAVVKQRHGWALAVMLFFTLNRELLIFLGPWYWFYSMMRGGWSLKNPAWTYSTLMVIGVLGVHFILVLLLGFSYHDNGVYYRYFNLKYIYAWFDYLSPARSFTETCLPMAEPLKFAAGVWLAALIFWRKLPRAISLGVIICLPLFWLLQLAHGGFLECRELYPVLPFMAAALLCFMDQSSGPQADSNAT